MKLAAIVAVVVAGCSLSELDRFYLAPDAGPDALCGTRGMQCCLGTNCETGLSCHGGLCVGCGRPDEPCCGTSCDQGAACSNGVCSPCGGPGDLCCPGGAACEANLTCSQNRCRGCAASISAGILFSCATRTDGTAWCWGANQIGELG